MPTTVLTTPNGSVSLLSNEQILASQGRLFSVTEPTLGTGVAYATLTGSSATANGFLAVQNRNPSGGANIYFDRLAIMETATAPTGTLRMTFEAINEQGLVTMTGNVATRTPVQMNTSFPNASTNAQVQMFSGGAMTIPAAVGTRVSLAEFHVDTGVCVANDVYTVDFGIDGVDLGTAGLTAARATAPATIGTVAPAIMVAPQTTTWLNMYWVTQAANVPSFTYLLTYFEV